MHFLEWNDRISNQISLKYVPRSLIDNNLVFVQVMAGHKKGGKPLIEPLVTQLIDVYMRRSGKMS